MEALSLMATLGLDSSDFEKGLSDSSSEAHSFASTIGDVMRSAINAVGEVINTIGDLGKKFVNAASEVAQYGDSIDKTSQKFGLSAQSYQEWDFILQHSGSSIGAMRTGMRQLSSAVASGSDAFQKLGISQADVASMSQEELFSATISALQNIEDETQRTAIATELFGRSAQELGPLLNTSAEDTEAMRQRVHDLGGVMSDEAVKASARYQDSLQDMQYSLMGIKNNMMATFLPGMATVMDGLADLFSGNGSGTAKIVEGIYSVVDNMRDLAPKLANRIKTTIKQVMPAIKVALKALVEIIGDLLPIIIDAITELVPIIAEALPGIIETTLPAILGALGTLVASIVTNLPAILSALWTGLKTAMSTIWTSLSNMNWSEIGTNILSWITGSLQNLGSIIMGFLGVPTDEEGTLQADWEAIGSTIKTNIETGVGDIADSIFGFIETAAENLKDIDWSAAFESLDVILGAIIEIAKGIGAKIVESIQKINWEEVFYNLLQALWNLIDQFGTWLGQKIQSVIDYFTGKSDQIVPIEAPTAPKGNQRIPLNGVVYELTPDGLFLNPNAGNGEKKMFTAEELGLEIDASGAITFASNKPNPELGEQAQRVYDMLMEAYGPGDEFDKEWSRAIESMGLDISENGAEGSEEVGTTLADALGTGGEEGAEAMKEALIRGGIQTADSLKKRLQTALNELKLPNFTLTPTTLGEVGHATAMDSGEILHGLTPFGIGSNGVVHFGGEAGPEAVVGVNSLNEMIQRSVNAAMANVQPMRQPINVQLLLDSGELLAAMDVGLNDRANWRGGGRA